MVKRFKQTEWGNSVVGITTFWSALLLLLQQKEKKIAIRNRICCVFYNIWMWGNNRLKSCFVVENTTENWLKVLKN